MTEPTYELYCLHTGKLRKTFTEEDAPNWLIRGGRKGSTMDNRWFWRDHVQTLEVGNHVETDFSRIKRIA